VQTQQSSSTNLALGGAVALLLIAPLVNVGPVNVAAFLLLITSIVWTAQQPRAWWAFWQRHQPLLLLALLLACAFAFSNGINDKPSVLTATFAQGRWLLLLTLAAPAVATGLAAEAWRLIFRLVTVFTLLFTTIYCTDALLYLAFNSNFVLDLIDADRSDLLRPSWVFNPHPFSRTLIAALLLLGAGTLLYRQTVWRLVCLLGMLGIFVMLTLGAVRTAWFALAIIAGAVCVLYARRRFISALTAGLAIGIFGLGFRTTIFPLQDPDKSLQLRTSLFEQGVRAVGDSPWFGGGYQAAREIPWPEGLQGFTANQTLATTNTHVQWLEMCVSYGLIGGLLFLLFWLAWGWLVFDLQRRACGHFRLPALLLLFNWISLSIAGFTTVYRESEWALWLITVLGALWLSERIRKDEDEQAASAGSTIDPTPGT
jgi:O-antigen ligase